MDKGKKEFAWRLFVRYSGAGSLHNPCNDDKEMILLDRKPIARDLRRFNPEYMFIKCRHGQSLDVVEYCGWRGFAIKRGDHKRKHDSLTPCYRAMVSGYKLKELEERILNLDGRDHAVWRDRIPVPIYKSLDEYFDEQKKE